MEKLSYLLNRSLPPADLREVLTTILVPKIHAASGRYITLNIADLDEAVKPVAPQRLIGRSWSKLGGAVEFWLDSIDQRGSIESTLAAQSIGFDGYLVTESLVQPFERSWADGERRPGVTQFCALGKPPAVSDEHFYHFWQQKHSPLSFRLHPRRWSYVRNAIARPLTKDAPPYRALVLEHFRDLGDFTDDSRYFGAAEVVREVYANVTEFCDVDNMANGPMSEYYFD
jgi:hypothetical protein